MWSCEDQLQKIYTVKKRIYLRILRSITCFYDARKSGLQKMTLESTEDKMVFKKTTKKVFYKCENENCLKSCYTT